MSVRSYRDLAVWQAGMELAEAIYRVTVAFPRAELFALTSQLRRAASSIPANIAEGWGRQGTREFQQFLRIAMASLKELETHLILARRVGLLTEPALSPLLAKADVLGRQILSLQRSLTTRKPSATG